VPAAADLAGGSRRHLPTGRPRSDARDRGVRAARDTKGRAAAWQCPGGKHRGASRAPVVAVPDAAAVPRAAVPDAAAVPRATVPWAAEARGPPGRADPSRDRWGTLPAGYEAVAAAQPCGPSRAGPRRARRVMAGPPLACRARQERPEAPADLGLRRNPAVARSATVPGNLVAGRIPERGRRGGRPAGHAASRPSSGSAPAPVSDVTGNHAPAGWDRAPAWRRGPDYGSAAGWSWRDAGGPRTSGTGAGPWTWRTFRSP
jgi:hypothetical protein